MRRLNYQRDYKHEHISSKISSLAYLSAHRGIFITEIVISPADYTELLRFRTFKEGEYELSLDFSIDGHNQTIKILRGEVV